MGTLGCINDMLQRDKENREIRKLGRERLKEIRRQQVSVQSSVNSRRMCLIGSFPDMVGILGCWE